MKLCQKAFVKCFSNKSSSLVSSIHLTFHFLSSNLLHSVLRESSRLDFDVISCLSASDLMPNNVATLCSDNERKLFSKQFILFTSGGCHNSASIMCLVIPFFLWIVFPFANFYRNKKILTKLSRRVRETSFAFVDKNFHCFCWRENITFEQFYGIVKIDVVEMKSVHNFSVNKDFFFSHPHKSWGNFSFIRESDESFFKHFLISAGQVGWKWIRKSQNCCLLVDQNDSHIF